MKAIVTFKLPRELNHDPRNKKSGQCPINALQQCTDITGQHHSRLMVGDDIEHIKRIANLYLGYHITRIEVVNES